MLTKAIAKYVTNVDSFEQGREDKSATVTYSPSIDYMRAFYIVDREGALWFSHAAQVRIMSSSSPTWCGVQSISQDTTCSEFGEIDTYRYESYIERHDRFFQTIFSHFELLVKG